MTATGTTFTLKTTASMKTRNEDGDEVFVSAGIEVNGVTEDELETRKASASELVDGWIAERAASVGAASFGGEEADADEEDESDEDEEGEEDEDGEEEEELPTEDEINAMKKADLDALIKEHELDIDPKMKLADKRAAIIEALLSEEDEEGDEEDEEEEEDEDEEGEDEEFEPFEEAELKKMKLAELQEQAEAWEIEVKIKKGADLPTKKAAYIKAILAHQEEAAEE